MTWSQDSIPDFQSESNETTIKPPRPHRYHGNKTGFNEPFLLWLCLHCRSLPLWIRWKPLHQVLPERRTGETFPVSCKPTSSLCVSLFKFVTLSNVIPHSNEDSFMVTNPTNASNWLVQARENNRR